MKKAYYLGRKMYLSLGKSNTRDSELETKATGIKHDTTMESNFGFESSVRFRSLDFVSSLARE